MNDPSRPLAGLIRNQHRIDAELVRIAKEIRDRSTIKDPPDVRAFHEIGEERKNTQDVSGIWYTEWSYSKNSVDVVVHDELNITQDGDELRGMGRSTSIEGPHPFESLTYELKAVILADRTIQGQWWNTNPSRQYKGPFQGIVSPSGREIEAKWIGTSADGNATGVWKWTRRELDSDLQEPSGNNCRK